MMSDEKMAGIGRVIRGSLFKGHDENKKIYISRQPYRPGANLPIVSSMEQDVMIRGVDSMYTYFAMVDCEADKNPPNTHLMIHFNTENIGRYIISVRQYPVDLSELPDVFETGHGRLDND